MGSRARLQTGISEEPEKYPKRTCERPRVTVPQSILALAFANRRNPASKKSPPLRPIRILRLLQQQQQLLLLLCANNTTFPAASMANPEKAQLPSNLYVALVPFPDAAPLKAPSFPTLSETLGEVASLFRLSLPIAVTALLLYSRSVVSMVFLGTLGELPLAAGSLAIAFANITATRCSPGWPGHGAAVLPGVRGEPAQAPGPHPPPLRALPPLLRAAHRPALAPHGQILRLLGQDPDIARLAQSYLRFSLPDLLSFSLIHPVRIYLRSQGITAPVTAAAAAAAALHVPANLLLVRRLSLGAPGSPPPPPPPTWPCSSSSSAPSAATRPCSAGPGPGWAGASASPGGGPCAAGGAELRVGVPRVVVVRADDPPLRPPPGPQARRGRHGRAHPDHGARLRLPLLARLRRVHARRQRARRQPPRARARRRRHGRGAGGAHGPRRPGLRRRRAERWGRMFTGDADILRLTAAALPIVGLCELGNCPQTVGCGVLRGTARPAHAAHVNLGAFYLVGAPVAWAWASASAWASAASGWACSRPRSAAPASCSTSSGPPTGTPRRAGPSCSRPRPRPRTRPRPSGRREGQGDADWPGAPGGRRQGELLPAADLDQDGGDREMMMMIFNNVM
uniref:Protein DETOXIFICATION n=1 Tax=Ananas comosus var. bracteatus TaxID=296719 RepID=A0A6V7QJ69_ANACO|nr:unnamed protein product [Ananas comosus var. bracteatus]